MFFSDGTKIKNLFDKWKLIELMLNMIFKKIEIMLLPLININNKIKTIFKKALHNGIIIFLFVSCLFFCVNMDCVYGNATVKDKLQKNNIEKTYITANYSKKDYISNNITNNDTKVIIKESNATANTQNNNLIKKIMSYIRHFFQKSPSHDWTMLLIGIITICITMFIPVAIEIFSHEKEFEALDSHLILDHLFKSKCLFFSIIGFFILSILGEMKPVFKVVETVVFLVTLGLIIKVLCHCYKWMKGEKYSLRFNFLKKIRESQYYVAAWRSVWKTENIHFLKEQEFFELFKLTIDKYLLDNEKKLKLISELLNNFNYFLKNRSISFLTRKDGILTNILDWHFITYKKDREYSHKNNETDKYELYSELHRICDEIFRKIEVRSLTEKRASTFLKILKEYVNDHYAGKYEFVGYICHLSSSFYEEFFQHIHNLPESSIILKHYFPEEWKITEANLNNTNNIVAKCTWEIFLEWARGRILEHSSEKDYVLDNVLTHLFPEVDPHTWAIILIFVCAPYERENRIRSLIERPWNFGFTFGERYKDHDERKENAIKLAFYLFEEHFSEDNLKKYLKLLDQLSYKEGTKEYDRKKQVKQIFENMLDMLEKFPA